MLPFVCEGGLAQDVYLLFEKAPSYYILINEEKGDEPLVGVMMLILPGQSPRICFEVCHHTACLNALFF